MNRSSRARPSESGVRGPSSLGAAGPDARARAQEERDSRARAPLPTRVHDLPELPPAYGAALQRGIAAIPMPPLDAHARRAIDVHVRLLLAWTRAINLTATREPEAVAVQHVVDSLAAAPRLMEHGALRIVDLGSGGGFPGLPLAAVLADRRIRLVESVTKKARFLEVAVAASGLAARVEVANTRAEADAHGADLRRRNDAVLARAVAGLAELVELGLPLLRPGGLLIAWKRRPLDDEIAAGERALGVLGGRMLAIDDAGVPGLEGHVLVVVEAGRSDPAGYPRSPAERRRQPW